ICVRKCREVCETCYRECCKKVCKTVTVNKCVTKRCGEWCEETYCKPGRCVTRWQRVEECCFDPCTCKTTHHTRLVRVSCREPDQTCTRKVWKERCVQEMVPCTTTCWETVREKVPYTVVRNVPYTEVQKVSCTVNRRVCGAYVDDKGAGYECDGPGRAFKE